MRKFKKLINCTKKNRFHRSKSKITKNLMLSRVINIKKKIGLNMMSINILMRNINMIKIKNNRIM